MKLLLDTHAFIWWYNEPQQLPEPVLSLQVIPITQPVVLKLDDLPLHHRDPFDRLIIAQARLENLWLVSNDREFGQYNVSLYWGDG